MSELNDTSKILRYEEAILNRSNASFSEAKEKSSKRKSMDSNIKKAKVESGEEDFDKEEDKENVEVNHSKDDKGGMYENTPEDEEFRNHSVLKGSIKVRMQRYIDISMYREICWIDKHHIVE